jgi:hypothetical protein
VIWLSELTVKLVAGAGPNLTAPTVDLSVNKRALPPMLISGTPKSGRETGQSDFACSA